MAPDVMHYVVRYWSCPVCDGAHRYSDFTSDYEASNAAERLTTCARGHESAECVLVEALTEHTMYERSAA